MLQGDEARHIRRASSFLDSIDSDNSTTCPRSTPTNVWPKWAAPLATIDHMSALSLVPSPVESDRAEAVRAMVGGRVEAGWTAEGRLLIETRSERFVVDVSPVIREAIVRMPNR
jgi:hypothetical protein